MGWSPPSKGTVTLSLILILAGSIIFVLSYFNIVSFPYDSVVAFTLACLAWILMILGVRMKGM